MGKRVAKVLRGNATQLSYCLLFGAVTLLLSTCTTQIKDSHGVGVQITKWTQDSNGEGTSISETRHGAGEVMDDDILQCVVTKLATKVRLVLPRKWEDATGKKKTDWVVIDAPNNILGKTRVKHDWETPNTLSNWLITKFKPPFQVGRKGQTLFVASVMNIWFEATVGSTYSCGTTRATKRPDKKRVIMLP